MTTTSAERAKDVFLEAIARDGVERSEFLLHACGDDAALRDLVDELLDAHEAAGRFLNGSTQADTGPTASVQVNAESPGVRIGRYKLLQRIGEGGFGEVWMAEQTEPVIRRVALKIIKPGMDSRQVIARFDAERQALAMMDHPSIARVFDAGATASGRPFFVMELVRGEPITKFCDRERLSVPKRLELFRDVCNAVQHAHQKGIIHRDLKPSNVMVTVADSEPMPKVIDFGIAKATAGRLTDMTLFTEHRALIGTPAYMSPEQAELSGADIDTRSDVYSLGVLLFELLTGTTPFDSRRLRSASFVEIQRIIREEEPPRPSVRFQTLASSSALARFKTPQASESESTDSSAIEIAQRRQLEPSLLNRAIRGDLDWIVMKCLDKDRRRRYATASALADDISRHLDHQPVTASPPSTTYKVGKFVSRNRGAVVAGALMTLTLMIAAGVSISFGLSENRLRKVAERATSDAQKRAAELEQVAKFQEEQLSDIDARTMGVKIRADLLEKVRAAADRANLSPQDAASRVSELEKLIAGSDFTGMALNALDANFFQPALSAIEEQFADQPLVEARLLQAVADALYETGLRQSATQPQERALAIRRELLGNDHPDTLASIAALGLLIRSQGNLSDAEPYYREALDGRRRVLGHDHPETLRSMSNMGALLHAQGRLNQAEEYYREALDKRRAILGEDHPDTLTSMASVGYVLSEQGKWDEAESYDREVLEKRRRILGDDHPHTLFSINNMAALLQMQRKFDESQALYIEALEKRRTLLGDDHPDTLQTLNNLGSLLDWQGKCADAEPYLREALERRRRVLGDNHPHTLNSISNMGASLFYQKRLEEAEPLIQEALDQRRRLLGDGHPDTWYSMNNMAMLLQAQGHPAEAEEYLRLVLDGIRRELGEDNPRIFNTAVSLTSVLHDQGKHDDAVELLQGIEPIARRKYVGPNDPRLAGFLIEVGGARVAAGQYESAEAVLIEAHQILLAPSTDSLWDLGDVLEKLVELYDAWHAAEADQGHDASAAQWRDQLTQWQATTQPATP